MDGPGGIGAVALIGVFAVVGGACRSAAGGERGGVRPTSPAGTLTGGGTVVVVPTGSQVMRLTFTTGGAPVSAEVGPGGSSAAFPLLAYRQFCEDVHVEDFGLVQPRLVVDIRLADGRAETLRIGATNFTGGGTYVAEAASNCVALVTTSSVHRLAALAGEAAAAPFRPVAETRPPIEQERPAPDPAATWVEQSRRAQARTAPWEKGGSLE